MNANAALQAPDKQALSWHDLSAFRGELMGLAMLAVMLFHTPLARSDTFYGLRRVGNCGVDVFLFLSGIGLWYAWQKGAGLPLLRRTLAFYWRRYLRIYPAWLIAACLFYIPQYWPAGGGYSPTMADLVANILVGWSFWKADDLTFWFIPCIMMLYTVVPLYLYAVEKQPAWRWAPVLMVVWYLLVRDYAPLWRAVGHVEIFWSRIPIFLLGINAATWVKAPRTEHRSLIVPLVLILAATLWYCIDVESHRRGAFPPATERLVYIPLAVSAALLLSSLLRVSPEWVRRPLRFVGGLSLELYLVHTQFVLPNIVSLRWGYWGTFFLMLALSLVAAWLLKHIAAVVVSPLPRTILSNPTKS